MEWVNCNEDLPQIEKGYQVCSVDCKIRTLDGDELVGYYNYRDELWHDQKGRVVRDVEEWQSLHGR